MQRTQSYGSQPSHQHSMPHFHLSP
jgi:hypothetical protein